MSPPNLSLPSKFNYIRIGFKHALEKNLIKHVLLCTDLSGLQFRCK